MSGELTVRPSETAEVRCPYCRDGFVEGDRRVDCPCGSSIHHECLVAHGSCPTLGCTAPRPKIKRARRGTRSWWIKRRMRGAAREGDLEANLARRRRERQADTAFEAQRAKLELPARRLACDLQGVGTEGRLTFGPPRSRAVASPWPRDWAPLLLTLTLALLALGYFRVYPRDGEVIGFIGVFCLAAFFFLTLFFGFPDHVVLDPKAASLRIPGWGYGPLRGEESFPLDELTLCVVSARGSDACVVQARGERPGHQVLLGPCTEEEARRACDGLSRLGPWARTHLRIITDPETASR